MKILVIHGPNLNLLGKRDSRNYGHLTLAQINSLLEIKAKQLNVRLSIIQSNHEGDLIDFIQEKSNGADGILINPGALTHYGYSLRDALADTKLPVMEIHLSDIDKREAFRRIDVLNGIVIGQIKGLKENSYLLGLKRLIKYIHGK